MMNFLKIFYGLATQLCTPQIAASWVAMAARTGITPQEAAEWANLGYMPGEADNEIATGVTLDMARLASTPRAAHIWRNGKAIV